MQHIHGLFVLQCNVITHDVANTGRINRGFLEDKSHMFKRLLEGACKGAVLIPTTFDCLPVTRDQSTTHRCHGLSQQTTNVALCSFDGGRDSTQYRVVDVCPEALNDLVRNLRLIVINTLLNGRKALISEVIEFGNRVDIAV